MENSQDNDLMEKVQNGDFRCMGLLFDRHHQGLFGFFYRMTNNPAQSEDMVQSVFYRLLKYRNTFRNEGKFIYWMYAVARNVLKDWYRKNDPMKQAQDLADLEVTFTDGMNKEEHIQLTERKQLLEKALQKLVPEQREAIILSRFRGFKYKEIAEIANVSENAIKARIRRGLLELQNILKNAAYN